MITLFLAWINAKYNHNYDALFMWTASIDTILFVFVCMIINKFIS